MEKRDSFRDFVEIMFWLINSFIYGIGGYYFYLDILELPFKISLTAGIILSSIGSSVFFFDKINSHSSRGKRIAKHSD